MKKIEFNHDWICKCQSSEDAGVKVTLPHDAMITEERSEKSLGIHNIGWFEAKDYVYSKKFQVPVSDTEKRYFLEIEGAYHHAEIYVNGTKIGYRPYGYSDFYLDATEQIIPGQENEIQIYTKNSDQPNSRWYSGTGLYRPVHMYVAEAEHILCNGVHVRTLDYQTGEIEVEVKATGVGNIAVQIMDGNQLVAETAAELEQYVSEAETFSGLMSRTNNTDMEIQGRATVQLTVPEPKLWNTDTPYLYQCRVIYKQDEQTTSFGIRTLDWNEKQGITLNGQHIILRGACIHHDNGILGACAYPEAEERKIRIMKENGYNAIRSAHNPCSKALLEACDRLGVFVMDEYVDVWYIHKTEHDYVDYMEKWWKTDLKEMVDKDYNHPSVIMYSTGNEVAETAQKRGIALTGQMTEYLHQLDATRPVSCGINIFFNFLSSIGFGVYSDEKAKKELENAKKNAKSEGEKKKKPVGSEFYNTLAGLLGDSTMKIGATLYPCDLKTKDAYANMDIAGYNYGIFRYRHDLKKYKNRLILGSETFCRDAYSFWEKAKKYPRIVGDFVWAGMDYIGEAGIGAWEYEDYVPKDGSKAGWLTAGSGRIDILGNPNGEALYTKVAFEQTDEIYIAVKPVYQTGKHSPSAWKMTEAVPSWSYRGCAGNKAEVEVYARAAEVELFLNGKSVGRKKLKKNCVARFHIQYEDGELEAVAYNAAGEKIKETSLQTADASTQLNLIPESAATKAEALTFIRLEYTDDKGIWKPMEKHNVTVKVEGGILKGLGNACSYNLDGYDKESTRTYYGKALAVVQADGTGPVVVKVTDETREYTVSIPCEK